MVQKLFWRQPYDAWRKVSNSLVLLLALFALSGLHSAHAAIALTAAPAGSTIGNQAAASYTDGSGTPRTATSNAVNTIVQQVGSFTLTQDNTKTGSAGTTVYFPHTITNTGNGTDYFNIPTPSIASGTFVPTGLTVYPDANGDGAPDNFTSINRTPNLLPGESFNFVVAVTIPGATVDGRTATINVDATSNFNGAAPTNDADGNDDVITVTSNAVVEVNKAISSNVGPSLTLTDPAVNPQYTYTFTYRNSGKTAASQVTITDTLDSRLTYVTSSGTWSGGPTVTDANDGATGGLEYVFDGTNKITATVGSVAPGQTGVITFKVTVNRGLVAPQTIPNFATFTYDSDGNGSLDGSGTTNTVNFNVTPTAGVTGTSPPTVPSAPQGSTVPFNNTFTNTGTGPDTFDITFVAGNTYPTGTTFSLYKSDGATPLIDTNSNGIPDTGIVAAGASYVVVVQVTLPTGAPPTPNGPYALTKRATSQNDPTKTATTTDTLTAIAKSTVDLTNTNAPVGSNGSGAGPEAAPITTLSGNPGSTVRFALSVMNSSATTDNYDLSASSDRVAPGAGTPGVSITYRNASGGVITNTGDVLSGGTVNYFADVLIPANAVPASIDLFFRALSPVTAAEDRKYDLLQINTVRGIAVEPNNTGQTFPGNTVVYTHTVTNTGNVTETGITLSVSNSGTGFTSTMYADTNGNGALDSADQPITSIATLAPGTSVTVFVSTFTPGNATPGQQDVATVTATSGGGTLPNGDPAPGANPSDTAADTTTIVAGQLVLLKEQALDANNDGTPDTAYSTAPITAGALPGTSIRYRITVRNIGTADVTNVVVADSTPAFTVYDNGDGTNNVLGIGNAGFVKGGTFTAGTAPTDGSAGSLSFNVGTLTPGGSAIVYFGARINQ